MLTRVSTASLHKQNLRDINTVQVDLATLNQQISSGKKAMSFDELNGVVERVSSYQTKVSNIDQYISNNTSITARLSAMDNSISQVQDIAQKFSSLISQRRTATNEGTLNFASQANGMLQSIAQSLNVSVEGRYLFSGSKTDTAPVTNPIPDNTLTGTPDDNYFAGNNDELMAKISDSLQISYGIQANDPAFQKLISAIKTGITADSTNSDPNFAKSIDLINESITDLAAVRTRINTSQRNIDDATAQHTSLKVYWNQALADDTSTDIAEASIKLATDQTVLQATFQAFASLSKLKLTDYLN